MEELRLKRREQEKGFYLMFYFTHLTSLSRYLANILCPPRNDKLSADIKEDKLYTLH